MGEVYNFRSLRDYTCLYPDQISWRTALLPVLQASEAITRLTVPANFATVPVPFTCQTLQYLTLVVDREPFYPPREDIPCFIRSLPNLRGLNLAESTVSLYVSASRSVVPLEIAQWTTNAWSTIAQDLAFSVDGLVIPVAPPPPPPSPAGAPAASTTSLLIGLAALTGVGLFQLSRHRQLT